jgi:hypothetical protein
MPDQRKSDSEGSPLKSFTGVGLDIAQASISDTLAMLRVSAETGLSSAETQLPARLRRHVGRTFR